MPTNFKVVAAIGLIALQGACTTLPRAEAIETFGKQTNAVAGSLAGGFTTMKTVSTETDRDRNAYQYLTGKPEELTPTAKALLDPKRIGLRVRSVRTLADYGAALAFAADG